MAAVTASVTSLDSCCARYAGVWAHHTCGVQTSTANLERVRKMKTRHQRLQTRVTTVREELQSFLEDDDDMMKMCLTHKMEQGQNQELVRAQG